MLAVGRSIDQPFGISLYHLYGLGVFGGWLSGNVYVQRTARLERTARLKPLLGYLFGPPGLLFLSHGLTSSESQFRVPLAPVYALGVYVIFFFVPVSFRRTRPD